MFERSVQIYFSLRPFEQYLCRAKRHNKGHPLGIMSDSLCCPRDHLLGVNICTFTNIIKPVVWEQLF